jgi:rubrerythrin
MSSSEEILVNLKNLLEVEKSAWEGFGEALEGLTDEKLKGLTMKLIKDEERHKKLIEEALELLKKK